MSPRHCVTARLAAGSVIHRTARVRTARVVAPGAGIGAAFELGDRLVDTAGVAADDPVDEGGRVIEIVRTGQQIRVLPHRVAGVEPGSLSESLPEHGGLAQLPWP